MEITCKLCDRKFTGIKGLSKHIKYTHKIEVKIYYDTYVKKNDEGFCSICRSEVKFSRFGYHSKTCSSTCSNKLRFPVTVEFWKDKGLSDSDALLKLSEVQAIRSKQVKNRKSNTTLQYYLNKGLSETDALSALRNRQSTRTLAKSIEKYGEIEGLNRWLDTNANWSKKIEEKYQNGEFSKAPKSKIWKVTSSSEIELASFLQTQYPSTLLFGENQLTLFDGLRYYYYDICDIISKKIIEYNGDYWHANPSKYKEESLVHSNKSAKQIWEADDIKLKIAKSLGYNIHVVWETDYLKNKIEITNRCLTFLNGKT